MVLLSLRTTSTNPSEGFPDTKAPTQHSNSLLDSDPLSSKSEPSPPPLASTELFTQVSTCTNTSSLDLLDCPQIGHSFTFSEYPFCDLFLEVIIKSNGLNPFIGLWLGVESFIKSDLSLWSEMGAFWGKGFGLEFEVTELGSFRGCGGVWEERQEKIGFVGLEEEEDPKTLPRPLIMAKMVADGWWAVGIEEQSLEGDPKCRYKDHPHHPLLFLELVL